MLGKLLVWLLMPGLKGDRFALPEAGVPSGVRWAPPDFCHKRTCVKVPLMLLPFNNTVPKTSTLLEIYEGHIQHEIDIPIVCGISTYLAV